MLRITVIAITSFIIAGAFIISPGGLPYPEKLSEWKLFRGKLSSLEPANGVVPYTLNTPLYSDYAEKARFVRLPKGATVNYTDHGTLGFPTGTVLVKNFYYSADFRKPGIDKNIVETRLLIKEPEAWKAVTYIWNDEQTEAILEIAGDDKQVKFIDKDGQPQQVRYVIPNLNQCKGCHNLNDVLMPIGPSAAQLNGNLQYGRRTENQLEYWKKNRMLVNLPAKDQWPRMAVWNDPSTGTLDQRARAYLAANCSHCHRREGPAQTSGLFLTADEKNPTVIGINKTPVAAGKGSGGRLYDIVPGRATGSIIWYRMQSATPGERMPELGRNMVHKEGLALITEWINGMKPDNK